MYCTFGKPTTRPKKFTQTAALQETVYNLIPKAEVRQEKPLRYKSVYSNSVKAFYESQKVPHKTMGYYKPQIPSPKNFLKKHSRDIKALDIQKKKKELINNEGNLNEQAEKGPKKPPVPRHSERPPMVSSPVKNFIKENIRNVSRTPAKRPVPRSVDSKKGDVILLEISGLVPKYCRKKEYGKTPKYLVIRQADMDYARQKYEEFVMEQCEKGAPKKIAEKERQELIFDLKRNWEEANKEYASLPLFTDTIRKKAHKEQVEERLRNLEKDIELLEKHEEIFILDRDHQ